jgi:hypothetical protein
MELDIVYQATNHPAWSPHYVYEQSFAMLKTKYPEVRFSHINPEQFNGLGFPSPGAFVVINPKNNKRIILSYLDNSRYVLLKDESVGWQPYTVQQLFCLSDIVPMKDAARQYKIKKDETLLPYVGTNDSVALDLDLERIIKPFNQVVFRTEYDLKISDKLYETKLSAKDRKQSLVFRGAMHYSRPFVAEHTNHPEISFFKDHVPDYYGELASLRCGLSLNGVAEICNRDLELMAIGIPIIRPLFKNVQFHEPLIPNVHYIPYDYDREYYYVEATDYPYNRDYKLHSQALIEKWEEVKNNYELLEFVGKNAREWYLRTGKLDRQVELFVNTFDINLLT